MFETLVYTFCKRPYVVAFLITYLFSASRLLGWRWTLIFLSSGYTLAFFSEYLSINFGLPYGWYFYKYENLQGEWLNHGVPVWDSASYVFMNYAGLVMARQAMASEKVPLSKIKLLCLSAVFVTLLDVVVDPVAHLGKHWFLGDIYYYPNPGWYFDVTMANFLGWYVTSLLINGVGIFALGFAENSISLKSTHGIDWGVFSAFGLYYGIMAFGIAIAAWLQEWGILLCDILWVGLTVAIIRSRLLAALSRGP